MGYTYNIINAFMRGQGMTHEEAVEQKVELVELCRQSSDRGCPFEIEDHLFDYGLELDYAEEIVHTLIAEVVA